MGKSNVPGFKPRTGRSKRTILLVVIVLLLILVGLDYLGWLKGGRTFVFPLILGKHGIPDMTQLYQLVTRQVRANGISRRAISGFTDRDGVFHLKVELPLNRYQLLAGHLEFALTDSGAKILSEEASQDADRVYYLWMIEGRSKGRIALLFACTLPPKGKKAVEPPAGRTEVQPPAPKLAALIIDDMGNSLDAAREVCRLGLPVTVAVLPFSLHGTETAQLAHECGLEVILHLPMESLGNHRTEKNTPGLITTGMSEADIRRTAEEDLEEVPYIRGMNNHMGSKMTGENEPLSVILEVLKGKDLYFIDSRTNPRSQACSLARTLGVPAAACSLFIDPGDDASALSDAEIKANFLTLVDLAKRDGQAIGIGHPRPATLNVLKECLPSFKTSGVTFVPASRLVQK